MKLTKTISLLFTTFFCVAAFSQEDVGLKGGLNYNYYGDGTIKTISNDITNGSEAKTGFHLGGYVMYDIPTTSGLTLRPELMYTRLRTDYVWGSQNYDGSVILDKIDVPFLIGKKIAGPLYGFVGPSLQIIINTDFNGEDINRLTYDDFAFGIQAGLGIKVGRLGFDVRWERGLNDTELNLTRSNLGVEEDITIDTRTNQVIFAVSYSLRKNLDNVK
jgi:hypothetical protein